MKTQPELFSIFQKFHAKVRTQFNTSIRILRSDNAKEYLSGPFSSFLSTHGILHQSSCAYTPQHNGVAKRKNRHLVETARTLLLHHKVPQRFWGDDTLAACYLINRMHSSVLHDQILHSILFPNQPLFCLPPCVFGYVCFVHILTPGQDKLSIKATKCVFLGYSRLQRGYRCYSPDTHRYFVFADVTFFEASSMFPTTPPPNSDIISLPLFYPIPELLYLDHCRFILVARILTPSLQLTHLLWRPPPRCQSCRLPLIFPFPFAKVLVPLLTLSYL